MRLPARVALLTALLGAASAGAAPRVPKVGVLLFDDGPESRAEFFAQYRIWEGVGLREWNSHQSGDFLLSVARNRDEAAAALEEMRRGGADVLVAVGDAAAEAATGVGDRPVVFADVDPATIPELRKGGGACASALPASDALVEDLRRVVPGLGRVAVYVPAEDAAARANSDWKTPVAVTVAHGVGASPEARAAAALAGLAADVVWLPPSVGPQDAAAVAAALAGRGIPLVGSRSTHLAAGAAVVCRADPDDVAAAAAALVGKLTAGADPAKLPVSLPKRRRIDLDLAAARRLGWTPPLSLVARADRITAR